MRACGRMQSVLSQVLSRAGRGCGGCGARALVGVSEHVQALAFGAPKLHQEPTFGCSRSAGDRWQGCVAGGCAVRRASTLCLLF